jgi:rare lipoprotein A
MRRAVIATIAIATLLTFTLVRPAFSPAAVWSSGGTQTGIAACYSRRLAGHRTSSGKRYNPNALTAAHTTIPNGTRVQVTNIKNGRSVVVLVNDLLPAHAGGGIIMDVSHRACTELRFGRGGEARVSKSSARTPRPNRDRFSRGAPSVSQLLRSAKL